VDEVRRAIARIVEQHLDEILDRTMESFDAALPSVANAPDDVRTTVRLSTRRATLAFVALYADPDSPARVVLEEARGATLYRAGELFEREDILEMLRIGRQVVFQSAREYVREAIDVAPNLEAEISSALESFMVELERAEEVVPRTDDAIRHLLADAEKEGPDLA
jgi:hypothetical protein